MSHTVLNQRKKKNNYKMVRRSKQAFLQRRWMDGQKEHEKMFDIINFQGNANQNYN